MAKFCNLVPSSRFPKRVLRVGGCRLSINPAHAHLNRHPEIVIATAEPAARYWRGLLGCTGVGYADQVGAAENRVGGVKRNPTGTRKIDMQPGMGRTGTASDCFVVEALGLAHSLL